MPTWHFHLVRQGTLLAEPSEARNSDPFVSMLKPTNIRSTMSTTAPPEAHTPEVSAA